MNIAILGLGTIGGGVFDLLQKTTAITVKRILDIKCWNELMTTDINDIINDKSIDAVVETMGGLHPAFEYAKKCIENGKHYITANKYLVSEFGYELNRLAYNHNVGFVFGAACGGGMPLLKSICDVLSVDKITEIGGILNGTTNFILDSMQNNDLKYDEALLNAQKLGYAEKDPTSDVCGYDTQRKLALGCGVAFGKIIKTDSIPVCGINTIQKRDIDYFARKKKTIKLVASAKVTDKGIAAIVSPRAISSASALGSVEKNLNLAWYNGSLSGRFDFIGQGAGKYPTAANIIRDLICIKDGFRYMFKEDLQTDSAPDISESFYARVKAEDYNLFKAYAKNIVDKTDEYIAFETDTVSTSEFIGIVNKTGSAFCAII